MTTPPSSCSTEGQALKGTHGGWVARGLLWTSQPLALEQVSKNDSGQTLMAPDEACPRVGPMPNMSGHHY